MASSPYSYSPPVGFIRDVCEPVRRVAPQQPAQGASARAAAVREPLDSFGERLLRELPPNLSLAHTARRYPHIVNKLSLVWNDSRALQQYVNSLLVDDRTDRQGFEFQTLQELTDVRNIRVAALQAYERSRR
jgi:hypothetical protein